jgi:N-acetylmuramoyl-L-alanine amidase
MIFNKYKLPAFKGRKQLLNRQRLETILAANPFDDKKLDKATRRKVTRWSIIGGNIVLLLGVGIFVIVNNSASQTVRSGSVNSVGTTASSVSDPLDRLSSAQIAREVAGMTGLAELTAVRNQADSENAQLAVAANDINIVTKPQLVTTGQKSKKDITHYMTKTGDTLTSIATTYGLNANSIRWSNGLTGDAVAEGKDLLIPPANGVVHLVKSGDTIDSVVNKYSADKPLFISVNDAEGGSLVVGDYLWVPGGTVAAPVVRFSAVSRGGFAFGTSALYGGNGYDYGYCTWWAAYRRAQIGRPVPSNLGNACTWKGLAVQAGLSVSTTPSVGAVIWTPSGCYGHVGFVEKVNDDGSVWVSDMNSHGLASMDVNSGGAGGWGRISYRLLSPGQAGGFWYIN